MTRRLRSVYTLIQLIVLMIGLSACVTSEVWFAPTVDAKIEIPAKNGFLAVTLIDASTTSLPYNHLTITPKNLNTSAAVKPVRLTTLSHSPNHSTVFFASVPAGEYTLTNIRGFYSYGDRWYSRWASSNQPSGTFTVVAGKISDLGRVILYPKVTGDRYQNLLVRVPDSRALKDVPLSNMRENMDLENIYSWHDDGNDAERRALYANIVQNPVIYNERYKSAQGNLYFVGKLGLIIKRDAAGEWSYDAVDSDKDLNAIYETDKGQLIVGGEYGQVFIKPLSGQWQAIPLPKNMLVDGITTNKTGDLLVVAHDDSRIYIYKKPLADLTSDWKINAYLNPRVGWYNAEGDPFPLKSNSKANTIANRTVFSANLMTFAGKQYLITNLQLGKELSIIGDKKRYRYEVNDDLNQFEARSDFDDGIDIAVPAGASYLGISKAHFINGGKNYFHYDATSESWNTISTRVDLCQAARKDGGSCRAGEAGSRASFEFMGVPVFLSESQVFAIVKLQKSIPDLGTDYIIVDSDTSGKSWTFSNKALPGDECVDTIPESGNSILVFCHGRSADFYESKDAGQSWQHVRESVKF